MLKISNRPIIAIKSEQKSIFKTFKVYDWKYIYVFIFIQCLIFFFRYELRDDRRKEIVRSSSHIDAVKRDIMRTMSYNQHFSLLRRSNKRQQNNVTEENSLEGQNDIDDQSRCVF